MWHAAGIYIQTSKLDIWHDAQTPHVIAIPFRTLYLKSSVKLFRSVP